MEKVMKVRAILPAVGCTLLSAVLAFSQAGGEAPATPLPSLPGEESPPPVSLDPSLPLPGQGTVPGLDATRPATQQPMNPVMPPGGMPQGQPLSLEQVLAQARDIVGEIVRGVNAQQMQQLSREAIDRLNFILQRDPRNIEAMLLSGELMMSMGQFDNARNYFKLVLDIEPQNFRGNFGTGKIWCANRFYRHAIRFLETAEQVAPATEQAVVKRYLAEAYRGVGENIKGIAKAEEAVRAARDSGGDFTEAMLLLLDIRRRDTLQFDKAIEDSDQLVQYAAEQLARDPSSVRAMQLMERFLTVSIDSLKLYHNMLYIRSSLNQVTDQIIPGKEKDAAAVLTKLAGRMENLAQTRMALAMYEVMILAEKASRFDPSNISTLEQYVDALVSMKLFSKAAEVCQQILTLNPNHEGARLLLQHYEAGGIAPSAPQAAPQTVEPVELPAAPEGARPPALDLPDVE
jgi:tetratricopeptide (TPR) repeat protein